MVGSFRVQSLLFGMKSRGHIQWSRKKLGFYFGFKDEIKNLTGLLNKSRGKKECRLINEQHKFCTVNLESARLDEYRDPK